MFGFFSFIFFLIFFGGFFVEKGEGLLFAEAREVEGIRGEDLTWICNRVVREVSVLFCCVFGFQF